jgi:hypothetical protein
MTSSLTLPLKITPAERHQLYSMALLEKGPHPSYDATRLVLLDEPGNAWALEAIEGLRQGQEPDPLDALLEPDATAEDYLDSLERQLGYFLRRIRDFPDDQMVGMIQDNIQERLVKIRAATARDLKRTRIESPEAECLRAIRARLFGGYENPVLEPYGRMSMDPIVDIDRMTKACLDKNSGSRG